MMRSMTDARPTRPTGLSMFFPAVNDGSTDATRDILDDLVRTYPNVRVIHHPRNRGYGAALRTGFAAATKDLIAYTDGDAQYDPAELPVLWNRLTPEADMVNG